MDAAMEIVPRGRASKCSKAIQLPVAQAARINLSMTLMEELLSHVHITRLCPSICDTPLSVSLFPVHDLPISTGKLFSQIT